MSMVDASGESIAWTRKSWKRTLMSWEYSTIVQVICGNGQYRGQNSTTFAMGYPGSRLIGQATYSFFDRSSGKANGFMVHETENAHGCVRGAAGS